MLCYTVSFLISALLLAVDQWAKYWTDAHLAPGQTAPLLGPVLELHCVHNYGIAWSLLSNMRFLLVMLSTFIVAVVIAVIALRLVRHPLGIFAAFLILSGGVGNLLDRIFLGYVVDMLRFPFWPSYPTFNVADMCIVSGCALWLIYALAVQDRPGRRRRHTAENAGESTPLNTTGTSSGTAGTNAQNNTTGGTQSHMNDIGGGRDTWQEQWNRRQQERHGKK